MRNQKFVSIVLSVVLSFVGVVVVAYGATTIGTNITTAGDVSMATASSTGQVKLDNLVVGQVSAGASISAAGAISASSTLHVYGNTTLVNASTTQLSTAGGLWVNGLATTTANGIVTLRSGGTPTCDATVIGGLIYSRTLGQLCICEVSGAWSLATSSASGAACSSF